MQWARVGGLVGGVAVKDCSYAGMKLPPSMAA